MMPSTPFTSQDFIVTMQKQLDAGSNRYQIRLQFEKYYYYLLANYIPGGAGGQTTVQSGESPANYIDISAGNAKLVVRYLIPE